MTRRRKNPAGVRVFRTQRAAEKFHDKLMSQGHTDAGVVYDAYTRTYRVLWTPKKNPSRIGKRVMVARRKKAAADRRVASALATYLKRVNPGAKLAGAKVQKLAGGVIKITPIKVNRGRR